MKVRINDVNNFYNGQVATVKDETTIAGVEMYWVTIDRNNKTFAGFPICKENTKEVK